MFMCFMCGTATPCVWLALTFMLLTINLNTDGTVSLFCKCDVRHVCDKVTVAERTPTHTYLILGVASTLFGVIGSCPRSVFVTTRNTIFYILLLTVLDSSLSLPGWGPQVRDCDSNFSDSDKNVTSSIWKSQVYEYLAENKKI